MAILTYTDLERYMGKTFGTAQQEAAAQILGILEAELQYVLNRPLGARVITSEKHMLEPGQRQIFLRQAPVRVVSALSIGLQGHEVAQTVSDFDIYPWGIDNIRIAGQGYQALVTYTAGLSDLDTVALERVMYTAGAREMSKFLADAQGLERLKVEGTDYYFHNKGESGFSPQELQVISRFKRRVIR
jgi:hypothetical protein